jgi:hypothetical protein
MVALTKLFISSKNLCCRFEVGNHTLVPYEVLSQTWCCVYTPIAGQSYQRTGPFGGGATQLRHFAALSGCQSSHMYGLHMHRLSHLVPHVAPVFPLNECHYMMPNRSDRRPSLVIACFLFRLFPGALLSSASTSL